MNLLLVEQDSDYVDLIGALLMKRGWAIEAVSNGEVALTRAREDSFTLVMLDALMRSGNGKSLTADIRAATSAPIVVLIPSDRPNLGVSLIEDGANYDLTKPFTPRRLRAALRAVVQPAEAPPTPVALPEQIVVNGLTIGLVRHEVTVGERKVNLSPREFAVFHVLLASPGHTFTRRELADLAWGFDPTRSPRLIDVYVGYLRRKIEPDLKHPRFILTARGAGYLWAPPPN